MKKLTTLILMVVVCGVARGQVVISDAAGSDTPIYHLDNKVGIGTTEPISKLNIWTYKSTLDWNTVISNEYHSQNDRPGVGLKFKLGYKTETNKWAGLAAISSSDWENNVDLSFYTSYSGNSNEKLRIKSNGNVGIGTTNPNGKLEVRGSINYSLNDQVKTIIHTSGDGNSYFNYIGGGANSRIGFQIDGGSKMSIMNNGDVGIGKLPFNAKLDVAGNIKAHEIEVTLAAMHDLQLNGTLAANNITYTANGNTADFVFEDNYHLKDLSEVEAFIKANKHLPEIPSAAEMEKAGVNLAEMNKLLLMKVEELTLYSIELEKEVKKVRSMESAVRKETEEKVTGLELKVEELSNEKRAMRGEMDERLAKMEALLEKLTLNLP